MKSIEQIAKEGYEKWREKIIQQDRLPPPEWDQALAQDMNAWEAATRHIIEQANQVH